MDNRPVFVGDEAFGYQDPLMSTSLYKAIKMNDEKTARIYINERKHLTRYDNKNRTPLHWAVEMENVEIINLLLQVPETDKNCKDFEGDAPLHEAVGKSCKVIKCLVESGCDVNVANNYGETPLLIAVKKDSCYAAKELLEAGADVNSRDFNNFTPLLHAVERNNLETVCMLLCYGADVTIQCLNGLTPFMHAINNNYTEISTILIDYYDDFSAVACDGYTALLLSANNVSPLALEILKRGASANHFPDDGYDTLLFSLNYPTAELFNAVWSRIDLERSNLPLLMLSLINNDTFSTNEWLQCIYHTLNSPFASQLVDISFSNECGTECGVYQNLFKNFFERNVPVSDRIAIITLFLSYGIQIFSHEINIICSIYGCNTEYDILMDSASIVQHPSVPFQALYETFLLGQEESFEVEYIIKYFILVNPIQYGNTSRYFESKIAKRATVRSLGYFSFPCSAREKIIESLDSLVDLKKAVIKQLQLIPELPTLLELARNQIRRNIKRNTTNKDPYYFYKSIKQLSIPEKLRRIVCFKDPLYGKLNFT